MQRRLVGKRMAALVALALPALLAACGSGNSPPRNPLTSGQASCPPITILADGADMTRYLPGPVRDLTAMVLDARISGFDAVCDYAASDRRAIEVRISPRFYAERGPAAVGRTGELPWFVAMTDAADQDVLDRQSFITRFSFPAGTGRTTVNTQDARLRLPIGDGVAATSYVVRLSFQLTPEELALNRSRGPR